MAEFHEVCVPQMGEGLRTVTVVRVRGKVGDRVECDSDIVEVETAKATLDIAAPVSGFISAINCKPGDVIAVGSTLLTLTQEQVVRPVISGNDNGQIRKGDRLKTLVKESAQYQIPLRQKILAQNLLQSQQVVIPASLEVRIDWDAIESARRTIRITGQPVPASRDIICWAIAQAMEKFEKFRCRMSPEGQVTLHGKSAIGIACKLEEDIIGMKVISTQADDKVDIVSGKLRGAVINPGEVEYHSVAISDMSALGVINGQPVVVFPSVATIFIGTPYFGMTAPDQCSRIANMVMAFDHRLINGAYAAEFLNYALFQIKAFTGSVHRQAGGSREKLRA